MQKTIDSVWFFRMNRSSKHIDHQELDKTGILGRQFESENRALGINQKRHPIGCLFVKKVAGLRFELRTFRL